MVRRVRTPFLVQRRSYRDRQSPEIPNRREEMGGKKVLRLALDDGSRGTRLCPEFRLGPSAGSAACRLSTGTDGQNRIPRQRALGLGEDDDDDVEGFAGR